jgi:hypothetical protein
MPRTAGETEPILLTADALSHHTTTRKGFWQETTAYTASSPSSYTNVSYPPPPEQTTKDSAVWLESPPPPHYRYPSFWRSSHRGTLPYSWGVPQNPTFSNKTTQAPAKTTLLHEGAWGVQMLLRGVNFLVLGWGRNDRLPVPLGAREVTRPPTTGPWNDPKSCLNLLLNPPPPPFWGTLDCAQVGLVVGVPRHEALQRPLRVAVWSSG